jgi:hypothetical protein
MVLTEVLKHMADTIAARPERAVESLCGLMNFTGLQGGMQLLNCRIVRRRQHCLCCPLGLSSCLARRYESSKHRYQPPFATHTASRAQIISRDDSFVKNNKPLQHLRHILIKLSCKQLRSHLPVGTKSYATLST